MTLNFCETPLNNFYQILMLLIIPFCTIFVIVSFNNRIINRYYQLQLAKKDSCLTKKVSSLLIFLGFFLILQNFTYLMPFQLLTLHLNSLFLFRILPVLSISAFFQLLILLTFFSKNEKKIKQWYNIRLILLSCLILTIIVQFVMTIWEFRTWQFASITNFLLLTSFYLSFITGLSHNFANNFIVLKYLITKTITIIFQKQKETISIKYKRYINYSSKWHIIHYLWNFNQVSGNSLIYFANYESNQFQITKNSFKLWIVSWLNLLTNSVKKLTIIINGWKNILRI